MIDKLLAFSPVRIAINYAILVGSAYGLRAISCDTANADEIFRFCCFMWMLIWISDLQADKETKS